MLENDLDIRMQATAGEAMKSTTAPKEPFDIERALARVEQAVRFYPKAAMFELAEQGYRTAFEQLVACIISIRTYDEVSLPTARRLFAIARTPEQISQLSAARIAELIHPATFFARKAEQIRAIAEQTVADHNGTLPCDPSVIRSFLGVGPKCANLTLGIACGEPVISVDVHVHRVTNRWGYVSAPTPERTMVALEAVLPRRYWREINPLLVPFGKHICTGVLPKCSTCPVLDMCRQVGVARAR
jgi:endonuclease-3